MGNNGHGGTRDPGRGRQDGSTTEIRAITEDDLPGWDRALAVGFLRPHAGEATEYRRLNFEPGRSLGAYDGERCVGTFRSFDTELTVPGGARVRADAISAVTVSSTHRRRGLLRAMMTRDLAAAHERGNPVAILIAAEYNIYGRYGFGPATTTHGWNVDLLRAGGLRKGLPTVPGGRIDFATMAEVRKVGPEFHERWRRTQPGAITRTEVGWRVRTGDVKAPGPEWQEPFVALHRDATGTVTGLVAYKVDDNWDGSYPDCTLTVLDLQALDAPTAVELWRFVLSVDWVRKVVVENLAPDDPLPLLLTDPRAATPYADNSDFTWLRVLDVEAAFAARSYGAPGRIVLDVTDPLGYADGRWALQTAADGTGRCTATTDEPDLALEVGALGTLYLGGESTARLAAAALVTELRPGAVARADLLLRTAARPWNPDGF
ncbi:GNAT family N-acetyltransferase [Kitasatospora herbaricolor]|uniref:GNAT family N-acetyltransferase n=1 Tax=Kitasatospora herbaricolor TaxID=68217 RepID=A0ABZ1WB51_9ACTN|nr:GNAT family N-acetyltransferase [Kitasatospora herbaricolor]